MRIKKEYVVLLAVIISAGLYLYLKERDRLNYQLPEPARLEITGIAKIEIIQPRTGAVTLEKADGRWRLADTGYPADEAQTGDMVEALAGLTLTALVSDSRDYDRYDLSQGKAILVKAWAGSGSPARELTVGKRAASGHHAFVRIGDDPRVYHAGGSLNETFNKSAEALRDRTVLSFDRNDIRRIDIFSAGETLRLEKESAPAAASGAAAAGEVMTNGEEAAWKTAEDQPVNRSEVEEILNVLSALKCDAYLPPGAEKDLNDPDYRITLTGTKTYTLALFAPADESKSAYAGSSSENPSFFSLSDYQAGRIMKKPSELITATEK